MPIGAGKSNQSKVGQRRCAKSGIIIRRLAFAADTAKSVFYESVWPANWLADWKEGMMALLSPSQQKEIISELESLAQLLGMDVVESIKFPTIMVRVSLDGRFSAITKRGTDFLATDSLPGVPMTFIGGGMFKYKVEV